MIQLLVAIRNILVVVILSWLGFSEVPKDNNAPEDSASSIAHALNALR